MKPETAFRFGTVGSPISTPKNPGGSIGGVIQINSIGLSALELGWVQSVRVSEETCQAIRTKSIELNVAISIHAPYYINLNASDEEWPNSRKRLMDAAYYGNLAGATDIVFHPGSYFNSPPKVVLPLAIDRLRECVDTLRIAGNLVTLRPETMGKIAMLGSFEDTLAMSGAIPGILPCLDFAHIHARTGNGMMNSFEEWDELLHIYAQSIGNHALKNLHIHLSGIEYSTKGERNHLPLRESDLNLNGLFKALYLNNCQGRILCESPILEDDALLMRDLMSSNSFLQ